MRKEYRKAVRERFGRDLLAALPGFKPLKVKSQVLFSGETVYMWAPCDTLHCFVILAPDPKGRQSFTVELAWSTEGRFPEVTARPTLMLGPGADRPIDVEEAIVRLGDVVDGNDAWWDLPDPALARPGDLQALQESMQPIEASMAMAHAAAPVEEALRVLIEGGVDFLETLATQWCGEDLTPSVPSS